jgi:hypothetical protein
MDKCPLELIEWVDATSKDPSWTTLEGTLEWAEKDECVVIEVGFVIKETEKYILVSSQICEMNPDDWHIGSGTKIPRPWIRKRCKLVSSDEK